MKAWLMAALMGGPRLVTPPPFTSSTTVVIPMGTSSLVSLVGKGGSGSPATPIPRNYDIRIEYRRYVNNVLQQSETSYSSTTSSTTPGDYCDVTVSSGGVREETCFYYTQQYSSPTTGANTTAFGKTFAGGVGGPATSVPYSDVPVTPGASYPLVIPAGGSITISYYA